MTIRLKGQGLLLLSALAAFALLPGCGPNTGTEHAGDAHADGDHRDGDHADGDHDEHEHDGEKGGHPEHGPNKGHIVSFDCGDYKAEWVELKVGSEESVVVIMLDPNKKEVAIPADSPITIVTTLKGREPQTFPLVPQSERDGKASRFESTEPNIGLAIDVSAHEGKILLNVTVGDKKCQAELVPHDD